MENLSHGIVSKAVHKRVQTGRRPAAGTRGIDGRSGPRAGGRTHRFAAVAAGVSPGDRERLPWQRQTALVGGPDRRVGTEGRPAGPGDRFFEGVLAAHRGTADAAGTDWKSAVYRKVQEEVKADRGLTIERMVELGRVSRSGFYRFVEDGPPRPDPDMDLRDAIQRVAL